MTTRYRLSMLGALVDAHRQAVCEGLSSRCGRRRRYSAHGMHPFCCMQLQSQFSWRCFAQESSCKAALLAKESFILVERTQTAQDAPVAAW